MDSGIVVFMAVLAGAFTHGGVRSRHRSTRLALIAAAALAFGIGLWFGYSFGGFWPGFYTLLTVFFLTTAITPWISFLARRRDDR